jgi:hypothetical protein
METYRSLMVSALAGALVVSFLPSVATSIPNTTPVARAIDSSPPNTIHKAATDLQFTSQGHVLDFRTGEFYVSNGAYALRIEYLGANPVAPKSDTAYSRTSPLTPPTSSLLITQSFDRSSSAPLHRVIYSNLWDGITLAYGSDRGGILNSSYRLEPGADPRAIQLHYNAPVTLNLDGTLTVAYETGQMVETAPLAWQEIDGAQVSVPIQFAIRNLQIAPHNAVVGFVVDSYNSSRPLFIDPTMSWNTFLGGTGIDGASGIALYNGNVYVVGTSHATWGSPLITYTNNIDTFVAKLNSSGSLLWNAFLGGNGDDHAGGIAVDSGGNAFVVGDSTVSWGSPLNAYDSSDDAFVAKLNSSGGLLWSTFLGGSGDDTGNDMDLDSSGNPLVAGQSLATWGSPERLYY